MNNAGIFIAKRFTNYTEAEFAAVVSTNLAGFFHITQRAIEAMERQGSGHIVNITTSLVNHANSARPVGACVADQGRPRIRPPSRSRSSTPSGAFA